VAKIVTDNAVDASVAAYSSGIYATMTLKVMNPMAANDRFIGNCVKKYEPSPSAGSLGVCVWWMGNPVANMKSAFTPKLYGFAANKASFWAATNATTNSAGAPVAGSTDLSAVAKFGVVITPTTGCTACLGTNSMLTASWYVPTTEAGTAPWKIANTVAMDAICISSG